MTDPARQRCRIVRLKQNPLLFPFLAVCSAIYYFGTELRRFLFSSGMILRNHLDATVICIGNLSVGGTGKSAAVISLSKYFQSINKKSAVLIRGYKRTGHQTLDLNACSESKKKSWEYYGDEALMIAASCPQIPVLIGADRSQSGRNAIARYGAEILIMDDGFQHFRLARQKDIVLVDARNPKAGGWCLPAGDLREPFRNIKRATGIIVTHADCVSCERRKQILTMLRAYAPEAVLGEAIHAPIGIEHMKSGKCLGLERMQNMQCLALAGIANPDRFYETLLAHQMRIVERLTYEDHHPYDSCDLEMMTRLFRQHTPDMMITTAKDRIRLEPFVDLLPDETYILVIEFRLQNGQSWKEFV